MQVGYAPVNTNNYTRAKTKHQNSFLRMPGINKYKFLQQLPSTYTHVESGKSHYSHLCQYSSSLPSYFCFSWSYKDTHRCLEGRLLTGGLPGMLLGKQKNMPYGGERAGLGRGRQWVVMQLQWDLGQPCRGPWSSRSSPSKMLQIEVGGQDLCSPALTSQLRWAAHGYLAYH